MHPSPAALDEALARLLGTMVAGKYRVERLLGQGGMGAVFQATNTLIGKRVALKFLSPEAARDTQAAERFQREARAASLVESEHIVQIFDFGEAEGGLPFLVMELLQGQDLRARLKERGRLSVDEALEHTRQILRALVRAHASGIVHRDLKPDNVFLCERENGEDWVKLVDFGISKLARKATLDTLTQRGTILGTAHYMSPEQAQGVDEVDQRSDLYSVGALLYEMLAGRPPHRAPTYEALLVAICTRDAEDVRLHAPDVSEALAQLLRRALERDRTRRFSSASEMLEALDRAARGVALEERKLAALELASPTGDASVRSRRRTAVAALMALLFGFAVTALFVVPRARKAQAPLPAPSLEPRLESSVSEAQAPPSAALPPRAPSEEPASSASKATESPAPQASLVPSSAPPLKPKRPALSSELTKAEHERGVISGLELNTNGP